MSRKIKSGETVTSYLIRNPYYRKKFQEEIGYQPTQAILNAKAMKNARIRQEEQVRQKDPELI